MIKKFTQEQFDCAKTRDLLELECELCNETFFRIKKIIKEAFVKRNGRSVNFCCQACSGEARTNKIQLKCNNCGKELERTPSNISKTNFCNSHCNATFHNKSRIKPKQLKPSRVRLPIQLNSIKTHGIKKSLNSCLCCGAQTFNNKFCSGSCRNKINNVKICGSRSKAENLLYQEIKAAFPTWEVLSNDRLTLDGLELDIYIPHLKLGIEWNGIFHYEPIHGQSKLEKVQNKDSKKISLCKEKGVELIVVCDRTSHAKFIKETVNDIIDKLKVLAHLTGIAPV